MTWGLFLPSEFVLVLTYACHGSLGKTIQTITRIIDGRPSRKEKKSEFSATTLCAPFWYMISPFD